MRVKRWYSPGEVAEISGLSLRQLGWARDAGAFAPHARRRGQGAWRYDEQAVDRARYIGALRLAGLSMQQARRVLPALLRIQDRPWLPGPAPFVLLVRSGASSTASPVVLAAGRLVTVAGGLPGSARIVTFEAVPEVGRG